MLILWVAFEALYSFSTDEVPEGKMCLADDDPDQPLKFTEKALVDGCSCVDRRLNGAYLNVRIASWSCGYSVFCYLVP